MSAGPTDKTPTLTFESWEVLSAALRAQRRNEALSEELSQKSQSLAFGFGQIVIDTLRNPVRTWLQAPSGLSRIRHLKAWRDYRSAVEHLYFTGFGSGVTYDPRDSYAGAKALLKAVRLEPASRSSALGALLSGNNTLSPRVRAAVALAQTLVVVQDKLEPMKAAVSHQGSSQVRTCRNQSVRIAMCLAETPLTRENGYAIRSHALLRQLKGRAADVEAYQFVSGFSGLSARFEDVSYHLLDTPIETSEAGPLSELIARADTLEARFRRDNINCVHAASNFTIGFPAAIAARRLGLPFIYEVRGFWEMSRAANTPEFDRSIGFEAQRVLEIETLKMADRVIALSHPISQALIARGISERKIVISRNGAAASSDTRVASASNGRSQTSGLTIGFIGSVTPYEGLDTLIDAMKKLKPTDGNIRAVIYGEGPASASLKAQIYSAGLTDKIELLGHIDHAKIAEAFAAVDIIYSVRSNSNVTRTVSPMKPLEALAHGKPVLCSKLPALLDLLEQGDHVIYTDAGDADKLATVLRQILKWSTQELESRSRAASAWVDENRSWADSAAQISEVYEGLMKA